MSIKNYSLNQLLTLAACTDCRLCVQVCPAVSAAQDGRLSGVYRLDRLRRNLGRQFGLRARLFGRRAPSAEELQDYSETVFRCTLCANCQEVCPAGLQLKDLWCSIRQDLVRAGAYPEKVDLIRDNLKESRNVFGEDNEERSEWVEDMLEAPEHGLVKERAPVVYFTGCVASFFPLAQKVPLALAEILEHLQVDFTLLGEEEWCCGFPLLGAGLPDRVEDFIQHNMAAVRARGAETLIFACPSCYHMWQEYYPREFRIAHVSEYLAGLPGLGAERLKNLPLKVTYHDPCDLGRGARVFEAPRRLIRAVPGVELVEMQNNRERCRCCGGGGNLEMTAPDLAAAITEAKIREALKTGAQAVVTSCQQCLRTMTAYVRRNNIPLEIMDITQLIKRALKI